MSVSNSFTAFVGTTLYRSRSLYDQLRRSKAAEELKETKAAVRAFIDSDVTPLLKEVKGIFAEDMHAGLDTLERAAHSLPEHAPKEIRDSFVDWEQRYQRAVKSKVDPLLGGNRQAMLRQLRPQGEEDLTFTEEERQLNRNLALAFVVTGASIATAPLGGVVSFLACVPLAMYLIRYVAKAAYRSVVEEHKLTIPVLMTTNQLLLWFGGFYTLGGVIFIFSLTGQKLGYITQNHSRKQLSDIFGKLPQKVWVLRDGVEVEIPFEELQVGDVLVVRAGQVVPIDGVIIEGYVSIDQHRLTGEAQPAEKAIGDSVLASTVVLAGRAQVRVERSGNGTLAANIGEMLRQTASYEMSITTRAYQMANRAVIPTLAVAGLAWFVGGLPSAVAITSTVFGFNLMLCGPLALRNFLSVATRRGILVKDGRSLELLPKIDTVVFDKTGTLTLDQPFVAGVHSFCEVSELELLRYAAALEQRQSHPIARAILGHARERKITVPEIDEARFEMGYGLRAELENKLIHVGSERYMMLERIALSPSVEALQNVCHDRGDSLVLVALNGRLAGAIELQPTIRPEAKAVVDQLRRRKLDFCIISGDHEGPTAVLAQKLGIGRYFANTLPEGKAKLVEQLQREGRAVCFVGDGINDSIALKRANVSVSLHGATTVAIDTAQVVLMDTTLEQLPMLFQLAGEMDGNLKAAQTLAIVPALGIWTGVVLFNLGILGAALIFELSLWTGIANALRPLMKYKDDRSGTN